MRIGAQCDSKYKYHIRMSVRPLANYTIAVHFCDSESASTKAKWAEIMLVLARAYRGQPLQRVAVRWDHNYVFLSNPDSVWAIEAGEAYPIGFPSEDVYIYESTTYDELLALWNKFGMTAESDWSGAKPFKR